MSSQQHYRIHRGTGPLLISVPHAGTRLPRELHDRFTDAARALPDTDWFVDRLYQPALAAGAGLIVARTSRYVVDLNRPPDDRPLYRSATTGLVPLTTFDGQAVYRNGQEPENTEIRQRQADCWRPYHRALVTELAAIKARHGRAVLLDAHSIAGELPLLFDGVLPSLNLGSHDGASASSGLIAKARGILAASGYSWVADGRFKGGYITRCYGQPGRNVHALQLEISQRSYMQERPPAWDSALAESLGEVLERFVRTLMTAHEH